MEKCNVKRRWLAVRGRIMCLSVREASSDKVKRNPRAVDVSMNVVRDHIPVTMKSRIASRLSPLLSS